MLMYPRLLSSSWFRQMDQPTYSGIVPLIYVNETICWYSALLQDSSQSFYGQGWIIWCHSKFYDIPFCLLTDWEWLYIIQLKTGGGGTLLPPSDVYVRSFLYLLYTLIKLYYTKGLSDPASSVAPDWILLLQRPRTPSSLHEVLIFKAMVFPVVMYGCESCKRLLLNMQRRWDSWPLEEKNSIRGQRRGWITHSFCVIKFY